MSDLEPAPSKVSINGAPPNYNVNLSYVGFGYNVIDGTLRRQLFKELCVNFVSEDDEYERYSHFPNFTEFERGVASRVGISKYESGMFSAGVEYAPFLCSVEKLSNHQYCFYEYVVNSFQVRMAEAGNAHLLFKDKQVRRLVDGEAPFCNESKREYFAVLERYGTHYIKEVGWGAKAELKWIFEERTKDTISKTKAAQNFKAVFKNAFHLWKMQGFSLELPTEADRTKEKSLKKPDKKKDKENQKEKSKKNRDSSGHGGVASTATATIAAGNVNAGDDEGVTHTSSSGDDSTSSLSASGTLASSPYTTITQLSSSTTNAPGEEVEMEMEMEEYEKEKGKIAKLREEIKTTGNLSIVYEGPDFAEQVSFKLDRISKLFPENMRSELEAAISVYIEENRIREIREIENKSTVTIQCRDTLRYLRVDEGGRLYADALTDTGNACKFILKHIAQGKVALKSLMYGKYLSKSITGSGFSFHLSQMVASTIGSNETFEISGEYIMMSGKLGGPKFLYVDPIDRQVRDDGSLSKKSRFRVTELYHDSTESSSSPVDPVETPAAETTDEEIFQMKPVTPAPPVSTKREMPALLIESKIPGVAARFLNREKFHREKHNSTSSLYIKDTLTLPNLDELTRCMAVTILAHIKNGHESPHKTFFDIFSEEKHPLTSSAVDPHTIPDLDTVYRFMANIFYAQRAYIERLITLTGVTLHASNWRRIVLSALILASKVWEDEAVWNVDFLNLFPSITVIDLNHLEKHLLELIQYNVSLKASLYTKYFFELRQLSGVDEQHFPLKPLTKLDVEKLEAKSVGAENKARTISAAAAAKRTHSMQLYEPKAPPVILN